MRSVGYADKLIPLLPEQGSFHDFLYPKLHESIPKQIPYYIF